MTGQLRQVDIALNLLTGHLKIVPCLPDILVLSAGYSGVERTLIGRILGFPRIFG
jgi:hypothetical protein